MIVHFVVVVAVVGVRSINFLRLLSFLIHLKKKNHSIISKNVIALFLVFEDKATFFFLFFLFFLDVFIGIII